jgi:hypothetical protein
LVVEGPALALVVRAVDGFEHRAEGEGRTGAALLRVAELDLDLGPVRAVLGMLEGDRGRDTGGAAAGVPELEGTNSSRSPAVSPALDIGPRAALPDVTL